MQPSPVDLDREPLELLPTLASFPGAALVHVPDEHTPVTLAGLTPTAELRIDANPHDDPIAAIAAFVRATPVADVPFPLRGGIIGYLGYELGHWTVPHIALRIPDEPLAILRRYDPLWIFDHTQRQWSRLGVDLDDQLTTLRTVPPPCDDHTSLATAPLTPAWTAHTYGHAMQRIQEHLAAGDIYQANLTQPYTAPLAGPASALFHRLARRHPVPYTAYFDGGDFQLVANSPEMFLRIRDHAVETRPIKGTRPRGADPAADRALIDELRVDEKERAEHLMIVDLERNDLGRVCDYGSVQVETLMAVESHPSIHHLVSSVRGRLRNDVSLADVLRATFPGGSITGAPKQRAMQILATLEPWPRGPYCGAFGVFDPGGDVELGLAIRTAVVRDGQVRWHAGGGIVVDSVAEREWEEAWLKTAALRQALAGA